MPPKRAKKRKAAGMAAASSSNAPAPRPTPPARGNNARGRGGSRAKRTGTAAVSASSAAASPAAASPSSVASAPGAGARVEPVFGDFFDPSKNTPAVIPALPDLETHPEILTAEMKTKLATDGVESWQYNLPMNYGYLPINEVRDKAGKPLRLPWWDMKKDALALKSLEPRPPTPHEKLSCPNWLGKTFPNLGLFYPLSADQRAEILGEILGFDRIGQVPMHMNGPGESFHMDSC